MNSDTDAKKKLKSAFLLNTKEKNRLIKVIEELQTLSNIKQSIQNKVFCIGSNKTGTTSLDAAMKILGFKSMPEELAYSYILRDKDSKNQVNNFRNLMKTNTQNFNFFEDLPFCFGNNYKLIDHFYPDAKYILTLRDPEAWFSSCNRWIEALNCKPIYSWIWGIDFSFENKNKIIKLYNKRNSEIIRHFNSTNKLMELQIETATYRILCQFLGIDLDSVSKLDFPMENINDFKK